MLLNELFHIHNAKSGSFETYEHGLIPFVSNGFRNNGILGLVKPKKKDRVFDFDGICISAFCEATVHKAPYLPRGNGGSGLTILEPKDTMGFEMMLYIASYINTVYRWRFSYGRMVVKNRIKNFDIKIPPQIKLPQSINKLIPHKHELELIQEKPKFVRFNVEQFFELERGDFHALDKLNSGKYPTISRVTFDNGIEGFYEKPKKAQVYPKGTITISTTSGDAFLQLEDFIATDNVLILRPKRVFTINELLFITTMLNFERWRISYGRQGYKNLFSKTNIFMPVTEDGQIDQKYIKKMVDNSYQFSMIEKCLTS